MNLRAKKSLGQHFLHSPSALAQIIAAARLKEGETVLEIGPGTGILTEALLQTGARVIAVEKDPRSIEMLKQGFSKEIAEKRLEPILGDILDEKIVNSSLPSGNGNYAIVANIPYYITGAILERFLEHAPRPNRMVLLVQKEVAERIIAKDKKESILSISVKVFGTPRILGEVPRGAFVPPPTVDSAILGIDGISDRIFSENKLESTRFFSMIRAGFAHKRKYLLRNLESVAEKEKLDEIWAVQGLDPKVRAEDLSVREWVEIAHACTSF